jgi:hypothetical protein
VSEPTLEELFLKLDLNGDGTLDLEEVVGGAAKLALSPEAAGALFAKLDTAGSGLLSRATFEDGAKVGGWVREEAAGAVFLFAPFPLAPRVIASSLSYFFTVRCCCCPLSAAACCCLLLPDACRFVACCSPPFLLISPPHPLAFLPIQLLSQLGKFSEADRPPFPTLKDWRFFDPAETRQRDQHAKACAAADFRRDNHPPPPSPPFGSPPLTGHFTDGSTFPDRIAHRRCRALYARSCSWVTLEEVAAVRAARAAMAFCAQGGDGGSLCPEDRSVLLAKPNLTSNWSRKVLFCPGNTHKR